MCHFCKFLHRESRSTGGLFHDLKDAPKHLSCAFSWMLEIDTNQSAKPFFINVFNLEIKLEKSKTKKINNSQLTIYNWGRLLWAIDCNRNRLMASSLPHWIFWPSIPTAHSGIIKSKIMSEYCKRKIERIVIGSYCCCFSLQSKQWNS